MRAIAKFAIELWAGFLRACAISATAELATYESAIEPDAQLPGIASARLVA